MPPTILDFHHRARHTPIIKQRLPNELWHQIITLRIDTDLEELLIQKPSDATLWTSDEYQEADEMVTTKRVNFHQDILTHDLLNMSRVNTFFAQHVASEAARLRTGVEKRYWELFDSLFPHTRCPPEYTVFGSDQWRCCHHYFHRRLTIKAYESALCTLYAVGWQIAVVTGSDRPSIEGLFKAVRQRDKPHRTVEFDMVWAANWMGIKNGLEKLAPEAS